MTYSKLARVLAVASLATAPAELVAAQEVEQVPYGVVAGLIGWNDLDLLIGRIPDGFPPDFPFPPGGRILGSLRDSSRLVVAVAVEGPPAAAVPEAAERLTALGWTAKPRTPGFVPSDHFASVTLCRGGDRLVITALPQTRLNVIRFAWLHGYPCLQPMIAETPLQRMPLPTLVAPAGAMGRGLGSIDGIGIRGLSATIDAHSSVEALLTHYSEQLDTQGWSEVDRAVARGTGVLSLRRKEGSVTAALTVMQGGADAYLIEFLMFDPEFCIMPRECAPRR